jgi:glycopeptide antibiotics resistance protein
MFGMAENRKYGYKLKSPIVKTGAYISLGIYLIILLQVSLISLGGTDRNLYFARREIHLIPFENTYRGFKELNDNIYRIDSKQVPYYWYLLFRNIVGNLLLLIPWGFLIPIIFEINSRKILLFSTFFLSLFIEAVQYIFILGVADVDDIIYNLLGALLGFYFFRLLK